MKFADNGLLYRGSKPVMWSVVEQTALAEAEVEYEDYTSDTVYVAFPVKKAASYIAVEKETEGEDHRDWLERAAAARVVIWTTTPWTIPGNRAISFSHKIAYGLYRVTDAAEDNWAKVGATFILAKALAEECFKAMRVEAFELVRDVPADQLGGIVCAHPLSHLGYDFDVPLFDGDHVTDDTGTGFCPYRARPRPRRL